MTYEQPTLPYSETALEPVISAETIRYHYGKHEKAYIDNLNRLIKGTEYEDAELEDIIEEADGALFNNASQAWNHIFYFFSFSPDGSREPGGELRKAIDRDFGSFDKFKDAFVEAGEGRSARAGYGSAATTTASSSSPRAATRRIPLRTGSPRCSPSTYGNMPTTSTTRTSAPTISASSGT